MPPQPCWPRRIFLFDLDGTLIDSRADIARSINLALRRLGLPALTIDRVSEFVGDGVQMLMQRTLHEVLGAQPEPAEAARLRAYYLQEYEAHMLDETRLYPGVAELLDTLSWGTFSVVSNKPERFSRLILDELGVGKRFGVILGGDSVPQRKPDPAPLLEALRRSGGAPWEGAMIGDSPVDVMAGKAAGVVTCAFAGGFRSREELEAAGADAVVETMSAVARCFRAP